MPFKLTKIKENIFKITEPYFYEHSNIFLLKGIYFDLLIDSGVGLENIKIFLNKNKFTNVKCFLTHAHFDHCGGINYFSNKDLIIKNRVINNLKDKNLLALKYLRSDDFNKSVTNKLNVNLDKFCSTFNIKAVNKIKPYSKNTINNGTFSFKIIYMPGHTDDSYVLYDSENKILITGDALYNGKVYADLINSNKKQFIKSLEKINKLDFELILSGHNDIMTKKESVLVIKSWVKELENK